MRRGLGRIIMRGYEDTRWAVDGGKLGGWSEGRDEDEGRGKG